MLTAFPGFVASLGFVPVMPFLEFAPGEGAIAETAAFFFYIPIATGGVVATPFRIVKEVFWDLPKAAVGGGSADCSTRRPDRPEPGDHAVAPEPDVWRRAGPSWHCAKVFDRQD
jgi:hypothetical protein